LIQGLMGHVHRLVIGEIFLQFGGDPLMPFQTQQLTRVTPPQSSDRPAIILY
jgi:hypothetical protein